jgi:hypothetical protein
MITGAWGLLASPFSAVVVGIAVILIFHRNGFHRGAKGDLARRKLGTVFILSGTVYTFGLCALSQLALHGPTVSVLIEHGFGNQRVAWLFSGLVIDAFFRLWSEFGPPKEWDAG